MTKENLYRSEGFLNESAQSTECHMKQRISGAYSFDVSPQNYAKDAPDPNVYSPQRKINPVLSSAYSHRNRFSKSMVDLSSSRNVNRKSVMFEEDLFAHNEMLQRTRDRFKELEVKYLEIFKNSRTSSVLSSCSNGQSVSFDRSESLELKSVERQDIQTAKTDTLQVLRSGANDHNSSAAVTTSRRRPPPLSAAMKHHYLEDSCDSAFDEIDHDRESLRSKTSREPTPPSSGCRHFLYPGESVESDKDSGISTDRPCTPNSRLGRPVRRVDPGLKDTQTLPMKSKSLTALSPRRHSLEYGLSDADSTKRHRIDRRGILKSVAYRNQGIKAESLDLPESATSPTNSQGRQSRSGSLSGNIRRGEFAVDFDYFIHATYTLLHVTFSDVVYLRTVD